MTHGLWDRRRNPPVRSRRSLLRSQVTGERLREARSVVNHQSVKIKL
jgi:hypothetical protein